MIITQVFFPKEIRKDVHPFFHTFIGKQINTDIALFYMHGKHHKYGDIIGVNYTIHITSAENNEELLGYVIEQSIACIFENRIDDKEKIINIAKEFIEKVNAEIISLGILISPIQNIDEAADKLIAELSAKGIY